MSQVSGVEMKQLLTALKRLQDPEDPITKALYEHGFITVNPDGIELSAKGEEALRGTPAFQQQQLQYGGDYVSRIPR
jgi:hypothetical protein